MKTTEINFKNFSDFRNRIAHLWQEQEKDEKYSFIFPNEEVENEFEELVKCFSSKDNRGEGESRVERLNEKTAQADAIV